MNRQDTDSLLDNIAEWIIDEDKIVTYKLVSKSLGVHVNRAKQLLRTYLDQQKTKTAFPISGTYLLIGKMEDKSSIITLVNESDLEATSSKFTEVTSEHVYSVQKSENIKEMDILCNIDKKGEESSSLVITSSNCAIKAKDKVEKEPESDNQEIKEEITETVTAEKETKVKSPVKKEVPNTPKKISPKKQKEKAHGNVTKTGNIATMFAKVAQKNSQKPKLAENEEKEKSKIEIIKPTLEEKNVEEPKPATNGEKKSEVEVVKPTLKEKNVEEPKPATNGEKKSEAEVVKSTLEEKNLEEPKPATNGEKKSEAEVVKSTLEEKNVEEKVRDIFSSSSDDDDDDDDDDIEVIEYEKEKESAPEGSPREKKGNKRKWFQLKKDSSDSESNDEKEPFTPVEGKDSPPEVVTLDDDIDEPNESQTSNKRKKRKIIDNIFIREDGYLETIKEVVFETDSEGEENQPEAEPKPEQPPGEPPATPKPVPSKVSKKQATLLEFFKKC